MRTLKNGMIIVDNLTELRDIVLAKEIPLDLIDIKESNLDSLEELFLDVEKINGSIENWDVSNIKLLNSTFAYSDLNVDLSKWDVSNVIEMLKTFCDSQFNNDSLKDWDVSNVFNMRGMFYCSIFNGDLSNWNIINCTDMNYMLEGSEFNGDISSWNFNKNVDCSSFVCDNTNFYNKYNNGDEITNSSKDFLEWFEEKRDKTRDINTPKEDVLDFFSFPCFSEQMM